MKSITETKKGRKANHHRDTVTGKEVTGLARQKDGRWRIVGTSTKFSEPDEQKAIKKYRRMTSEEVPFSFLAERVFKSADIKTKWVVNAAEVEQFFTLLTDQNDAAFWARVEREIRTRPKFVAAKTSIEQIGYLTQLQPPEKLPTFAELKDVWLKHSTADKRQKNKVEFAWNDFVKTTGVKELPDITTERIVAYRDAVYARNFTGKSQQHLFAGVRRMVNFAYKERAIAVDTLSTISKHLSLLKPSETTVSLDPQPIEIADFEALLKKATGDDLALILLCLNGAFYLQEAVRLNWSDIKNECIITHRKKTGKCVRVCVLWPETIAALEKIERLPEVDCIFRAYTGKRLGVKGAEKRFRGIRDAAELPGVTSSQLRDGAMTAAVEAGTNSQHIAILMGQRSGIADHYLKRNPKMIAGACLAIRKHYFEPAPEIAGEIKAA